ncbi:GNAT family N-acetyltransferase (plasmid) [Priestia aryabhattai]|uniref:GNAT family N-acetyltransferase n=1 Tax=Priestia aryabhattai TaxID=412384 RepID=UPI0035ABF269
MYLRRRIPYQDDSYLINLATNNFNIEPKKFESILRSAHEVIVLCNNEDEAVGFFCYRFLLKNIIFIDYVILDTQYQGKGIAHSLLPNLVEYAKKQGIRGATGYVSKNNSKALQIFKHWGFKPIVNFSNSVFIGILI